MAESRTAAEQAFDKFLLRYEAKYAKLVSVCTKIAVQTAGLSRQSLRSVDIGSTRTARRAGI
jgi:hypothetical protein